MLNMWIDTAATYVDYFFIGNKNTKTGDCFSFISKTGTLIFFVLHVLPEHH